MFEYTAKNTELNANALDVNRNLLLHFAVLDTAENTLPPIFNAIKNQPESVQALLLNSGASLKTFINHETGDMSPLQYAITLEKLECVKTLVQNGADVNEVFNDRLPLEIACAVHNLQIVNYLLANGADANLRNKLGGGISILHNAIKSKNSDIVRELLKHGADGNFRCKPDNTFGIVSSVPRTALELSVVYAHIDERNFRNIFDMISVLLQYANVNEANPVSGETLLHLVCLSNSNDIKNVSHNRTESLLEKILKYFLKCGADVNALDSRGLTPLHYGVRNLNYVTFLNCSQHIMEPLVASIAKRIVKKEWVIEANLKLLKHKSVVPIYEKCMEEIDRMKENICESLNFSFLGVLTKDIDVVGCAFENKDHYLKALNEIKFIEMKFPIYAGDLEARIWAAKLRHLMVEFAFELFNKNVKKNYRYGFLEISKYLDLEDLYGFMKAYSDVLFCYNPLFFSMNNLRKSSTLTMRVMVRRIRRLYESIL